MGLLDRSEQLLRRSRPLWRWLGQIAVVVLGVHLVADRLDDLVFDAISAVGLPGMDPQGSAAAAAWVGVSLELAVVAWATWTLWVGAQVPAASWKEWRASWSLLSIVRPVFWLPVSLAGCWVLGMSVEDSLVGSMPSLAESIGWTVYLLAAWRLSLSGTWVVARGVRSAKRRTQGWWLALPLLAVALTAARLGLPIWSAL